MHRMPHQSPPASANAAHPTLAWTARGLARYVRSPRYVAFGPGVLRKVKVAGNTITLQGILPPAMRAVEQVAVSAEVAVPGNPAPVERLAPHVFRLTGIRNPEEHLSSLTRKDGPFAVVYESFHYLSLPRPQDLSCTVINGLGDKFDFLAYYSDLRIDNQEAGTPSDGPKAGNVLGTGEGQHDLKSYCSQGRFQWGYVQPVYVGSNQMQERPPAGAPVGNDHDITFYTHQLEESSLQIESSFPTITRCRSSGMRWAIAGPRLSRQKSTGKQFPSAPCIGREACKLPLHFLISGPRKHRPWAGASGRTTSMERTRNSTTTIMCQRRAIPILTFI